MDFTEIYKQTASLVAFSPGTHFLLTAVQDRLVVRRSDSFQISRTWLVDTTPPHHRRHHLLLLVACAPPENAWITHAGWSCDSEYVLGACAKRGVVAVFKLRDEDWSARIEAGAEGLVKAEWAPDGRSVLCFSEWGLRVTIWSLVSGTATYIQYPVHPDRGYAFRRDARYFVLAERHKSKDTLGVYDAHASFRLVRHFPSPPRPSPPSRSRPRGTTSPYGRARSRRRPLGTFSPEPDPGFGIRAVAWHPSGLLLAIAGADDKIHILESLTWGPVATLELPTRIPAGVTDKDDLARTERVARSDARPGLPLLRTHHPPHTLPLAPPPHDKQAPQLAFNTSGTLLLARPAAAPTALLLYVFPGGGEDTGSPRLRSVLLHARPVAAARWNPVRAGSLAACCGVPSVYLWSDEWVADDGDGVAEEVAECVGVPAQKFETRDVRWAPDGKGLVLLDRDTFCCAFEVEEDGQVGEGGS
ncbi:WD repeat-containing protein WRAP73 [Grifola frondosa]|uniref:WD repeat-containing protein WRAP73 n=1 Tax=Grifola frondosa TaxID=5627 RepID=A0A1C7ME65_GRIFR|nr:WD repeat-containing protein WRAP73 [Grifola frondosa]